MAWHKWLSSWHKWLPSLHKRLWSWLWQNGIHNEFESTTLKHIWLKFVVIDGTFGIVRKSHVYQPILYINSLSSRPSVRPWRSAAERYPIPTVGRTVIYFLFFFLSFVCLFLFRGGVCEGVGEEEEEKKKKGATAIWWWERRGLQDELFF